MRGKRSKQYRKLMEQFSMTFGFREPYQVLVDAEMVKDSCRFKMDLTPALERTVHGKVKPMITQCEIRKLYAQNREPGVAEAIDCAKTLERRRCGHHPDEFPEPLGTQECLTSIIDPKDTGTNKHRYVVASQSQEVRRTLRGVKGVPLVYIKRSVMILEPMADDSMRVRMREEKSKFRQELKSMTGKRKREDGGAEGEKDEEDSDEEMNTSKDAEQAKKKKKRHGVKGPNPLAVKKPKAKPQQDGKPAEQKKKTAEGDGAGGEHKPKRKRKRTKTAASSRGEGSEGAGGAEASAGAEVETVS